MLALLFFAGLWAGAQNALAGGGSFVTLPALIFAGVDPKIANITSTIALFPGQVAAAAAGREMVGGTAAVSLRTLAALSLGGGVAGAGLLLLTPSATFAAMLPWLVLAATALFAAATFGRSGASRPTLSRPAAIAGQFASGVYGGYFGGGNGFVVLTLLTLAGVAIRRAGATKNLLVALANGGGVLVFALSGGVDWARALAVGAGAVAGGQLGVLALRRVPERALRIGVIVLGLALAAGLFARGR